MNEPAVASQTPLAPVPQLAPFVPLDLAVPREQQPDLLECWRSIAKRKWAILSLAGVVAVLAAAVALSLTPVYRSTTTILIEVGKGKILSIEDVYAGTQQREDYQTQVEILKSREVANRTARALKLWEQPEFDPRKAEGSWAARTLVAVGIRAASDRAAWAEDQLAEASTELLMKALTVEPVRLSNLVKVSFESSDKVLAARVANTLGAQYIGADRDAHFAVFQQVSSFLSERLASLREKLAQSEQALQAYRDKHGIVNLGGSAQTPAGQQISATTERLISARAKRTELESAYQQLRGITNGDYSSSPVVMGDPAVMESVRQLNDVNRRLAEMSDTLGPNHTKVLQSEAEKTQITAALARQRSAAALAVAREYEAARSTEQSLERALNTVRSGVRDANREEFRLTELEREVQTNRQLYDMFVNRAKETNLASGVQASVGRVVDTATPAERPFKPARAPIVLVATVLALFIGAVASLLLDRLDDTVKSGDDAEARLKQPLLTALPDVPNTDPKHMASLLLGEPQSQFAEAIRTARTGVMLSNIDHPNKVLLVTSTLPGEGKTTFAINLALAYAQTRRTLLIDADMRRAQVGRSLRIATGSRGLTNLMAGTGEMSQCILKFKGSGLFVMPVGDVPPQPLEMLLSQRFREMLALLSSQFEIVIIDSPPVELVSEALILTPMVTSTVVVVKAMATPAPLVRKTIQRLQRAGGVVLGVVVNRLDFKRSQHYYGQYGAWGDSYGGYQPANPPIAPIEEEDPGRPQSGGAANASVPA